MQLRRSTDIRIIGLLAAIGVFVQSGFNLTHASAWDDYSNMVRAQFEQANRRLLTEHPSTEHFYVEFIVKLRQNGSIARVSLNKSSGREKYDSLTLQAIKALTPLPTPPTSVYLRQLLQPIIGRLHFEPSAVEAATGSASVAPRRERVDYDRELVRQIQSVLNGQGYSAGAVDGLYGPATRDAIQRYQEDYGLSVDGRISRALLGHIEQRQTNQTVADDVPQDVQAEPGTPPEVVRGLEVREQTLTFDAQEPAAETPDEYSEADVVDESSGSVELIIEYSDDELAISEAAAESDSVPVSQPVVGESGPDEQNVSGASVASPDEVPEGVVQ